MISTITQKAYPLKNPTPKRLGSLYIEDILSEWEKLKVADHPEMSAKELLDAKAIMRTTMLIRSDHGTLTQDEVLKSVLQRYHTEEECVYEEPEPEVPAPASPTLEEPESVPVKKSKCEKMPNQN